MDRLLGGHPEIADFVASGFGRRVIVSLMTQNTSGTSYEKVPFEVISLDEVVRASRGEFDRAYLVLAGDAWPLLDFYLGNGLAPHLKRGGFVKIVSLDEFLARAAKRKL